MAVCMSINLSNQAANTIKGMADKKGVTVTEMVRLCLATEIWRERVKEAEGKVLVEDALGEVREILFPY